LRQTIALLIFRRPEVRLPACRSTVSTVDQIRRGADL